jgi:general secretion pathway protein G
MLVVTVIVGTLSSMAAPTLQRAREQAEQAAAMAELRIMSAELLVYMEINFAPPVSLAAIDRADLLDPWGNPYYYLSLVDVKGKGSMRKNKFLVPLNTDFDLYSAGPDGETKPPLTTKVSQDDILRALDGGFFGVAEDFLCPMTP